jgi:hypothetical protein
MGTHAVKLVGGIEVTICGFYNVHVNAHRGRLAGGKAPIRMTLQEGEESEISCVVCRMGLGDSGWKERT